MLTNCKKCNRKFTKNNKRPNRGVCRKCEYLIRKTTKIKKYKPNLDHCIDCKIKRSEGIFKRIHGSRCVQCFKMLCRKRFKTRYYRNYLPIRYKQKISRLICDGIYNHFNHIYRMNKKFDNPLVVWIRDK